MTPATDKARLCGMCVAWVPLVVAGLCAFSAIIHVESRKHGITVGMNNIVHQRAGSFVQPPATTSHKGSLSGVMQPEERLKTYRFSPQWQCIASQGNRKPGNYRPHYSADWQRGIAPAKPSPTASPPCSFLPHPPTPIKSRAIGIQCPVCAIC